LNDRLIGELLITEGNKLKGRPSYKKGLQSILQDSYSFLISLVWIRNKNKLSMGFAGSVPLPEVIRQGSSK
jgi:hypothetical protein